MNWREDGNCGWTPTPLTDVLVLVATVGVLTGMVWAVRKLVTR